VLRYANGNIVLFEALGGTGVTLTDWKDFIDYNWNDAYTKIVFRKLICKRTTEMLTEFENFIKASLGKAYKIKTSKLCCNKKKASSNLMVDKMNESGMESPDSGISSPGSVKGA
jgi:hypothetical protein